MRNLKFIIIVLISVIAFYNTEAQSIFKSYPKPAGNQTVLGKFKALTVSQPDSIVNVCRITVVGSYVFPNPSGATVQGGIGYAYQHLKYDYTNIRWQSQWSVGGYALGGTSIAPKTPQEVASLAALFGFAKDLFRVGPVYHVFRPVGTSPWAIGLVIGGNFNN